MEDLSAFDDLTQHQPDWSGPIDSEDETAPPTTEISSAHVPAEETSEEKPMVLLKFQPSFQTKEFHRNIVKLLKISTNQRFC